MKTDIMILALLNSESPAGRLNIIEDVMDRVKKLEAVAQAAKVLCPGSGCAYSESQLSQQINIVSSVREYNAVIEALKELGDE